MELTEEEHHVRHASVGSEATPALGEILSSAMGGMSLLIRIRVSISAVVESG